MQRTAVLAGDLITLRFTYDPVMVDQVKTLPGRRFIPTQGDKHWTVPVLVDTVETLLKWDFALNGPLANWLQEQRHPTPPQPIDPRLLEWGLFPFQAEGVAWLDRRQGRGLIGDEMGLGKTVQALGWLRLHPELRPALVVCPATLKINWEREAHRWVPGSVVVAHGGEKPAKSLDPQAIHIINYDVLMPWVDTLRKAGLRAVVLDEFHRIKNKERQRSKAIIGWKEKDENKKDVFHPGIATGVKHVICLSGTPIENRPAELFSAISLVAPNLFPSKWKFLERYCGLKHNGYGWEAKGATNSEELHHLLTGPSGCMIRRLKSEVLKDLPAKQRCVVPLELTNTEDYQLAEDDFAAWLSQQDDETLRRGSVNALAQCERLKQLAIKGKMDACVDWIKDFLEGNGKLVVFCHHQTTVAALSKAFAGQCVVVDGDTPPGPKRQASVDAFQNDDRIRLFIGTLAAIEGLTLTAASHVAFLELWWAPGQHDQAEDRTHRIGQKDSVTAYYLIAAGTIEERIARLLDSKRKVVAGVLDGSGVEADALLSSLLKEYRNRKD